MLVLHYYVMNLKGWQKHEILANEIGTKHFLPPGSERGEEWD